jgi:heterodisulfide reductase subunit A-like polyferredoxin
VEKTDMIREVSTGIQELETDVLVIGGGGTGLAAAFSNSRLFVKRSYSFVE